MTPAAAVTRPFEDLVVAQGARPGEPPWLLDMRREAWEAFPGFPSPRDEAWLFTSLKALAATRFRPGSGKSGAPPERFLDAAPLPVTRVVVVDGRVELPAPTAGDVGGIRVERLQESVRGGERADFRELGLASAVTRTPFPALNAALWEDGVRIVVPPGGARAVVHVLLVAGANEEPAVSHPRIAIQVGAGAEATVVEEFAGTPGTVYFRNAVTEIVVGENAALTHVKLTRESDEAFHVGTTAVRLERAARFISHSVSLEGRLARHDLDVVLAGEGSECDLFGLYAVSGRQHVDHHTSVDHASPHTVSRELYKGVLDGASSGVFHGRVVVRPGAQKTESGQTNKNLLLSEDALVNTNPELEIRADDVQARHGATIGQLDPDQLFYLRSRGIPALEGRRLLIQGFGGEMADRLPVPSLVDAVRAYLGRRF